MRRLAFVLLALAACKDWKKSVQPERVAAEPVQESLQAAEPITYALEGYQIALSPRASYRITGYVVETSRKLLDRWDFVMPLDVALIWGPIVRPELLADMSLHLSNRYVSWRWQPKTRVTPMPPFESHVANNHLIPSSPAIAKQLARVRIGDLVTLEGKLVDVEIKDGAGKVQLSSGTSLRRDDVGSGACEQLWVEAVSLER